MPEPQDKYVVIVDDDENFLSLMRFYLGKLRINVVGYQSTTEALESDRVETAAMTLVDLGLSDANGDFWEYAGIEVVCALRNRYGASPKIWMVTGRDRPGALLSCLNNGANGIIMKHTNFKKMTETIQNAIKDEGSVAVA